MNRKKPVMNYHTARVFWRQNMATAKQLTVLTVWDKCQLWPIEQIASAAGVSPTYAASVICEEKLRRQFETKREADHREAAQRETQKLAAETLGTEPATIVELLPAALAPDFKLEIPSRWAFIKRDAPAEEVLSQLEAMAQIARNGSEALVGLYMRICDVIRQTNIPHKDARKVLSKYFCQPRVSEILRVSRAPHDVYTRYRIGFFGFKAALRATRLDQLGTGANRWELNRKRAVRHIRKLLYDRPGEIEAQGWRVTLTQINVEPKPADVPREMVPAPYYPYKQPWLRS